MKQLYHIKLFMKKLLSFFLFITLSVSSFASQLIIPMDEGQSNHLKAYGIAFWVLKQNVTVDWLLNYRGGSFAIPYAPAIESECKVRGVGFEIITGGQYNAILTQIADPEANMDVMKLEKAPKVAV